MNSVHQLVTHRVFRNIELPGNFFPAQTFYAAQLKNLPAPEGELLDRFEHEGFHFKGVKTLVGILVVLLVYRNGPFLAQVITRLIA